jgi:hypothetical protein
LVPGSEDPEGASLQPGDFFNWTLQASGGQAWRVDQEGSFFPLMAFAVDETANREGSYTLTLSLAGQSVWSLEETSKQSLVHMGTNSVYLPAGLSFDRMALSYELLSSVEDPEYAPDPENLQPTSSTIRGLLPIFGAPEMNIYYPGISFGAPVPEPATWALMLAGLVGVAGLAARRR